MKNITLTIISIYCLSLSGIYAKKTKKKSMRLGGQQGIFFKKYDTNKDGKISEEEYMKVFLLIDKNKDKQLDLYEIDRYYKRMQKELKK